MKIKFSMQKRSKAYVTIFACACAIWMMVVRFGFPVEEVLKILWLCLGFLVAILLVTVPLAFFIRWLSDRKEDE